MLKSLFQVGFAWRSSEARRQRRQVEDRLRTEAEWARIEPSRDLYRRTLAALNDVSTLPAPAVSISSPLRRGLTGGYALAFVSLVVIGAVAVQLGLPRAANRTGMGGPAGSTRTLAIFDTTGFDSMFQRQLKGLNDSWGSPLQTEARLLVRDARTVSTNAMATVSLLTVWDYRGRSDG